MADLSVKQFQFAFENSFLVSSWEKSFARYSLKPFLSPILSARDRETHKFKLQNKRMQIYGHNDGRPFSDISKVTSDLAGC